MRAGEIIDDLSAPHPMAATGTAWRAVTDRVMGGVSSAVIARADLRGRPALVLEGRVRLENDGGFVQLALDLAPGGATVDASGWDGIAFAAIGNGERYGVHLRTDTTERPWQSWRAGFIATSGWNVFRLPFSAFAPHRIDGPLDPARLRRIGFVAIGRAFDARLGLADIRFWRAEPPDQRAGSTS
jgi:hypothetical protein